MFTFERGPTVPPTRTSTHKLSVPRKKLSAAAWGDIIGFAMGYSDTKPKGMGYSDAWDMYNVADKVPPTSFLSSPPFAVA